jgi:hypothetical protein
VQEIRGVAVQKLSQKNPGHYGDGIEESFQELLHSKYLTINHLPGIAEHYNRVIVLINPDPV